ncbi:MAG: cell division protein SepF [Armatimonadetes bacterium]|nr:cell division protein SepF [Armatimonadota bacterium]
MSRRAATEATEHDDGWISRLKERWFGESDEDAREEPARVPPPVAPPRQQARRAQAGNTLHLVQNQRTGQITKRSPRSLADAQKAAEDLKDRCPIIVNLEGTDDDMARRVIDFISGVTYALNGYYERVGAKVFLFTPSNVIISDEDELEPPNKGPYATDDGE